MNDLIELGYVARAHGVRGEIRVVVHHRGSPTLLQAPAVVIDGRRFRVAAARRSGDAFLLRLGGIDDRNRAEALRGKGVAVDRDAMDVDPGEVVLADLIGWDVVRRDGSAWGRIVAIDSGPQDRLVIRQGRVERLLPFVAPLVCSLDEAGKQVVVDPPDGLPEELITPAKAGE